LSPEEIGKIRQGLAIPRRRIPTGAGPIAAVEAAGRLVAVLTPRGHGLLGPLRNLPAKE
jgi:hypothetical protein